MAPLSPAFSWGLGFPTVMANPWYPAVEFGRRENSNLRDLPLRGLPDCFVTQRALQKLSDKIFK